MNVVTDSVFFSQHSLVAALRVFWSKLPFLFLEWVTLFGNILQVDCGQHLFNLELPAARHLFHRALKLKVLNHLKGACLVGSHVLDRASMKVLIRVQASRVVVL